MDSERDEPMAASIKARIPQMRAWYGPRWLEAVKTAMLEQDCSFSEAEELLAQMEQERVDTEMVEYVRRDMPKHQYELEKLAWFVADQLTMLPTGYFSPIAVRRLREAIASYDARREHHEGETSDE